MNINHQITHMLQRPLASTEQPGNNTCEHQSLSCTSLYIADVMIQRIIFLFLPVLKLSILSAIFHLPKFDESQNAKSKNDLVKLERYLIFTFSILKNYVHNYFLFDRLS